MPSYELMILLKNFKKPELASIMKRAAGYVFENNGILRKIEYLGLQPLHYRLSTSIRGAPRHNQANFVLYHLDLSPEGISQVYETCRQDNDIVRAFYVKKEQNIPDNYRCSLSEELQPPSYRKSVQKLIQEGKKSRGEVFDMGDSFNARQIL